MLFGESGLLYRTCEIGIIGYISIGCLCKLGRTKAAFTRHVYEVGFAGETRPTVTMLVLALWGSSAASRTNIGNTLLLASLEPPAMLTCTPRPSVSSSRVLVMQTAPSTSTLPLLNPVLLRGSSEESRCWCWDWTWSSLSGHLSIYLGNHFNLFSLAASANNLSKFYPIFDHSTNNNISCLSWSRWRYDSYFCSVFKLVMTLGISGSTKFC